MWNSLAAADLDQDGDLEILFADDAQHIHAYHHDGTAVAGFPLDTGHDLSPTPVAAATRSRPS